MTSLLKDKKIVFPVILLVLGIIFLLNNYGIINTIPSLNLSQNWPIILIIVAVVKIVNIKK